MSGKATGDAFENSPLSGQKLVVHLAIADVVNDVHEYRLWMNRGALAEKAKTSRGTVDATLRELVDAGWLEVLTAGGGRGNPTEYRYRLGGKPRKSCAVSQQTAQPESETAQSEQLSPLTNRRTETRASARAGNAKNNTQSLLADKIAREWWESREPRPIQPYIAVKKLLTTALVAGHSPEAVAVALRAIQGDPPIVAWRLEKALAKARGGGRDPAGMTYARGGHDPHGLNWDRNE